MPSQRLAHAEPCCAIVGYRFGRSIVMIFMRALFILLTMVFALNLCAAETEPLSKTVDYLIGQVEKSNLKFVRNGDEHTGKEAAEHMRRKYNHFKKEIKTPEDFIEKCAAK